MRAGEDVVNKTKLKEKLLADRAELIATQAVNAQAAAPVELDQSRVGRLSRMDAMQAQAMSMAARQRLELQLTRIASTLKRLDDVEYGCCVRCGESIAEARLEFDPTVLLCIECANDGES